MRKIIILGLIILLVSNIYQVDDNIENMRVYEQNEISEFRLLLEDEEYDDVKEKISLEKNSNIVAKYKAMALDHIQIKTDEIMKLLRNHAIETDEARNALNKLKDILIEFDKLYRSFNAVDSLEQSNINYMFGINNYSKYNYKESILNFEAVIKYDKNYDKAIKLLSTIREVEAFWDNRKTKNLYGRNPYSLAYNDGYIYYPYTKDDITMIVSHNPTTSDTKTIPIIKHKGDFTISGINVIGDYIYFIAGENVGRGLALKNPYNIYKIRIDGSDLTCLAQGHFFDLICFGDEFYALSYDEGLVKFDRYLINKTTIIDNDIISMNPCKDGIYYVMRKSKDYKSRDSLFFFNGKNHTNLMTGRNLRVYPYEEDIVFHKYAFSDAERLYLADKNFENKKTYLSANISEYIGRIDDTVYLLTKGEISQEKYISYTFDTRKKIEYSRGRQIIDYIVEGVCEQNKSVLLRKKDGMYLSGKHLDEIKKINIPNSDMDLLVENEQTILKLDSNEVFKDEEKIMIKDNYWHYSSKDLYVSIEREYVLKYDAVIYLTHVKTNNERKVSIGYFLESPGRRSAHANTIAQVNKAVFAVNGDFWAEPNNPWTGIIIRDGKVYKQHLTRDMIAFLPDGGFECYSRQDDDITPDKLLEQGIKNTMSFGPVLLDDLEYGHNVDNHFLWGRNPRTSIGMIDPNHYVFVSCDGRSVKSRGLTLRHLADIYKEQGCTEAYNLDGGQSTAIVFMGNFLNTHQDDWGGCFHRNMSEVVYVGESEQVPYDGE